MTETITSSTLFNSFSVWREILTGITALSTLNSRWSKNTYYFEDFPPTKASNFVGFPIIHIETDMDTKSLSIKDKKQMLYVTTLTLYTDEHIEKIKNLLNSYLNEIVYYINVNKQTLRWTYGLFNVNVSKSRVPTVIDQKEMITGVLEISYNVTLNTGS